jgi:hypothetical protein
VAVNLPPTAHVGDTFEAALTVSADNGQFPPTTVSLHARVIEPRLTFDPPELDFGDVPVGGRIARLVSMRSETAGSFTALLVPSSPELVVQPASPGFNAGMAQSVSLTLEPTTPGERELELTYRVPWSTAAPACSTGTLKVRARAVAPGDAGASDAGDAATETSPPD